MVGYRNDFAENRLTDLMYTRKYSFPKIWGQNAMFDPQANYQGPGGEMTPLAPLTV